MSWGEIKKAINSDLNEPLNYLAWINDLATFGEDGYVANDVEKLTELSAKSRNAINHKVARNYLFERIIKSGSDVGAYLEAVTGDTTGAFDGLATIGDVVADATAMTVIVNSETAMTVITNSETAMTAIANSETAMTAIVNSETAMTAIANSETAMTAIANSETAMEIVFGVVTPNYSAREVIWDNENASEIIMTNIISRGWLVANIQENVEEKTSTGYVLKVNKKCLVLAVERFGTESGGLPVNYRFIQPGNLESGNLTTMTTRVENKRVYPLGIRAGVSNADYVNIRVYYVQMQE